MRACLLLVMATMAVSAEVARGDLQFAIEDADGAFDYTLGTPVGTFTGSDAYSRLTTARLGGRWGWSSTGSSLGLLAGADLVHSDGTLDGGSLSGWGLEGTVGGTWALADRWSLDGEVFIGMQQIALELQASGSGFTGDGTQLRDGARLRLLWHVSPRWSLGLESGWQQWSADLAGSNDRSLALEGGGLLWGLALAWRPSVRPAGVE